MEKRNGKSRLRPVIGFLGLLILVITAGSYAQTSFKNTPLYKHLIKRRTSQPTAPRETKPVVTRSALPETAKLLPHDTAVLINIDNLSRLKGQFEKTDLFNLYKDPSMAAFVEKFKADLQQKIKDFDSELAGMVSDAATLPQGKAALALVLNDKTLDAAEPPIMFIAEWGDKAAQVKDTVERIAATFVKESQGQRQTEDYGGVAITSITGKSPGTMSYCFIDDAMIASANVESLKFVIGQVQGAGSPALADDEDYNSALRAVSSSGPGQIDVYVNIEQIMQTVTAQDESGKIKGILTKLGLDNVTSFALSIDVGSTSGKALLKIDGAKKGICKALEFESAPVQRPRFVSASANSVSFVNLNVKKAFDEIVKMLTAFSPEIAMMLNMSLSPPAGGEQPLQLKTGIIDHLGSQIVVAQSMDKSAAGADSESGPLATVLFGGAAPLRVLLSAAGADELDFSLLPDFDAVRKYFGLSASYGIARQDGFFFEFKYINPVEQGAKAAPAREDQQIISQRKEGGGAGDVPKPDSLLALAVTNRAALEKSLLAIHSNIMGPDEPDARRELLGHTIYRVDLFSVMFGLGGDLGDTEMMGEMPDMEMEMDVNMPDMEMDMDVNMPDMEMEMDMNMPDMEMEMDMDMPMLAFTVTDTHLIFGSEDAVERAIRTLRGGKSLASAEWFAKAKAAIPSAVGLAVLQNSEALAEFAWSTLRNMEMSAEVVDISADDEVRWVKCNNKACNAEYEMGLMKYYKNLEANMDSNPMAGPAAITCEKCGKLSVYAAIKCPNADCGKVFIEGSAGQDDYPDRCPDCGKSEIEQKSRKRREGSIVSINAGGQTVGSVLTQIEKATGNQVRIVDEFRRDDKRTLSKRISVNLQDKSFWEAIDAVSAAAGVKFNAIEDGTLRLSTEEPQFDRIKRVGTSTVVGAFQMYPGFDNFFGHAMIIIRPEPQMGKPQLRSYQAEITLPGGEQIQYKPDFMFDTSSVHTGEFTLRIDPDDLDLPKGTKKAQDITIEALLAVASDFKAFTLPPLGELVPKPVTVGDGVVYVTKAALDNKSTGLPMFSVDLRAEGLPFDLKDIALVDGAGNRVKSSGGGGTRQENRQDVSLNFTPARISGDPSKCQLAFDVPGTGERTIGPLGDVAPKSTSMGASVIRITGANMTEQSNVGANVDFEVRVEFDGFPASRDGVTLVGTAGRPLVSNGWSGGGNMWQFWFDAGQIRGQPESYRLRFRAPTKVTEHVLRATFNDVPLMKEE